MNKLKKNTYPAGHKPEDFVCSGPPALVDAEFGECMIADLGCFDQTGRDCNKYYHAAIVRSRKDNGIWVYLEWGRTGAENPAFMFVGCDDETEARKIFSDQLRDKNVKRGNWVMVGTVRTLQAKLNQDCYLVRPMAARSTGLPDARTIRFNEGAKKTSGPSSQKSADLQTISLVRDLSIATVAYAKLTTSDACIPTQKAIDEARKMLQEDAMKRIAFLPTIFEQQSDPQLIQMTKYLYGKIPKKKARNAAPESWLLNQGNILAWLNDLDAFESALYSAEHYSDNDPLAGLPIHMEWVDPKSTTGFIYKWWPKASNNRHGYLKDITIKNIWKIQRHGESLTEIQKQVVKSKPEINVRPLFQEERPDLSAADVKLYKESNTALLFHGSRSVNVGGILQKNFRLRRELVNVHLTGALFGGGIYFAEDWRKSAGYTSVPRAVYTSGEGAIPGRAAFMFAADVVLGSPYVAPKEKGYTEAPRPHHSVMGKEGFSEWHDGRGKRILLNNEYVVYDANQQNIRYLAEFAVP